MQKYPGLKTSPDNDDKYWKEIAEKAILELAEKDSKPNIQDDELNTLIYLLKEYTKKKLNNSNSLLVSYYQLYLIIFMGACALMFFYFQNHTSFHSNVNSIGWMCLILISLSMIFWFNVIIRRVWVDNFTYKFNTCFSLKISSNVWHDVLSSLFTFLVTLLLTLPPTGLSVLLIGYIPSSIIVPTCIVGLLILLTLKRLRDKYHDKSIIDQNLAKIIRVSSQAREHVYSGFGKKVELDVRLTEAEDALKNPRLYI
jgi:hypothetical protein